MSLCASKTGASCSATTPHVSALLDRLLHHAHVLKCGPKSYRTRAGREESAHPRNRADHRAGGALQAPRPRSAVTALALAPCVRRWSLVSQRFAAGAAAPVKPGGRSWPRTAGVRRERREGWRGYAPESTIERTLASSTSTATQLSSANPNWPVLK
jgi:hypothetical protein